MESCRISLTVSTLFFAAGKAGGVCGILSEVQKKVVLILDPKLACRQCNEIHFR